MPLIDIDILINDSVLPDDVVAFLREADLRVSQFVSNSPVCVTGFVPSDFVTVYHALRAIAEANLARGNSFCEWGSGLGVVASLAAMLDFKVCGIEIESGLIGAARSLADDFGLPVEFIQGSFIPQGAEADVAEAYAETSAAYFRLDTDAEEAYAELGLGPNDFDVIFAYPWPGEECLIEGLFEKFAAEEALLLTYTQYNSVRLQRKVGEIPGSS